MSDRPTPASDGTPYAISFTDSDKKLVAAIEIRNGKLTYIGNMDEATRLFFEQVAKRYWDPYVAAAVQAEKRLLLTHLKAEGRHFSHDYCENEFRVLIDHELDLLDSEQQKLGGNDART